MTLYKSNQTNGGLYLVWIVIWMGLADLETWLIQMIKRLTVMLKKSITMLKIFLFVTTIISSNMFVFIYVSNVFEIDSNIESQKLLAKWLIDSYI